MKARIFAYVHAANGLSVEIVPETEAESAVLSAAWKHGYMDTAYSGEGPTTISFLVRTFHATAKAAAAGGE